MTRGRPLPPPLPDGIPRPVPTPGAPPEAELEVTDFVETPTRLEPRRCQGCAGRFIEIEGDGWIPVTYEQAWGGPYKGACRGSVDPSGPWWCKAPAEPLASDGEGRLVIPEKMEVRFFPERRQREEPVTVERRRGS